MHDYLKSDPPFFGPRATQGRKLRTSYERVFEAVLHVWLSGRESLLAKGGLTMRVSLSVDFFLHRLAGGDNESIEITCLAFILASSERNAGAWGTLHPCHLSFYVPPLGGVRSACD